MHSLRISKNDKLKKTTQFKNMINSNELEFIMEAHSGLSAKIVEEQGFKGIWGSGLSISAALGVRDNNELSWTQVLDMVEFMSDATSIPLMLDGDTGYGNFNNVRRLIRKLEQRQVAAVCIEDKLFPKTNSFIGGEAQPLADIDEFAGKIKAAKDSQSDDDFCVVARLEAFIAGWGLSEALRRAEAYMEAGADAVLCHSKRNDSSEIEQFMKEWAGRLPVVIVPTKYYSEPTEKFRNLGVSMIIWANHNLRSSMTSMQKTTSTIFTDQSLINVEGSIKGVSDIFRIQGADELKEAEAKYLPTQGKLVNNIILAASQGNMGDLTKDKPKTLLNVKGKTILSSQIEEFNRIGIKDITVVRGFGKELVNYSNIKTVDNDIYHSTKELYSLFLAIEEIKENTVISYGDIIFKQYILNELLNDPNDITLIIDADIQPGGDARDWVENSKPYSKRIYDESVEFKFMSSDMEESGIHGEFIGLWKVNSKGSNLVKETLIELSEEENFKQMTCADLFNKISEDHPIAVRYINGSWLDVDTIVDLQKAGNL
ncbi:MAG: phosphoenolpyruvate mutase [Cyclobacteriaceae bacterium]|nr:MAG: phosphoenolpyruvate mutase [Cyclobacteriaceae bacterium]